MVYGGIVVTKYAYTHLHPPTNMHAQGTSLFQNQRPDKFGQFSISMYTMWSVMTFDDTGSLTNELMDIQEGPFIKVAVVNNPNSSGFLLILI